MKLIPPRLTYRLSMEIMGYFIAKERNLMCRHFPNDHTFFLLWNKSQNENEIYKSMEFISNLESKRLIHLNFEYICIDCNQKVIPNCDLLNRMANYWQKSKRYAIKLRIRENSDLR